MNLWHSTYKNKNTLRKVNSDPRIPAKYISNNPNCSPKASKKTEHHWQKVSRNGLRVRKKKALQDANFNSFVHQPVEGLDD